MFEIIIYNTSGQKPEWAQRNPFLGASNIFAVGRLNHQLLAEMVGKISGDAILLMDGRFEMEMDDHSLDRLLAPVMEKVAGIAYSDYQERCGDLLSTHAVNDYQLGSIRDDFDFGPVMVLSAAAAKISFGPVQDLEYAGFYDLRLRVSEASRIIRSPECLYTVSNRAGSDQKAGERHFDYVDPANRAVQVELEKIATAHLKRIGAYLLPEFDEIGEDGEREYPVEASVIIPVKNRVGIIGEAVSSALTQKTDFPFNVIVVDNHSGDGTGEAVTRLAGQDTRVLHLIPRRTDLEIGGCWNEAIHSEACGRFAVQLDSDDLYSNPSSLQAMVGLLRTRRYAMAIGSYQLVNSRLEPIPPGLIDHREWTEENGRNNALRVNGLGAPRAFVTRLIRREGFPNVSYGEDYTAALALSRRFRIGRIYENLYLCRRWEGNTDSALSLEQKNRNDAYKDGVRTTEILARQQLNERRKRKDG